MTESKALDAAAMLADRKAGMTYAAIGEKHGCSDMTAITRIRAAAAAAGEPVPQSAFAKQPENLSASPGKQPAKSHAIRGLDGDAIRADHAAGLGRRRLARKYQCAESVIGYHLKKVNKGVKSSEPRIDAAHTLTGGHPTNKPLKTFAVASLDELGKKASELLQVRVSVGTLDRIWASLSPDQKVGLIEKL